MAPHALYQDDSLPSSRSLSLASRDASAASSTEQTPYLRHVSEDEVHDLVCIGFGPASLAVAVALHDTFEAAGNRANLPKVAFLERQSAFAWHAGMQIPGAKMQISFIKDMATTRNPRSHFTFVNYLHQKQRLVQFTNIGTFLPRRVEYEDYMRWCASHFDNVVSYGQEVLSVRPDSVDNSIKPVSTFSITSKDISTGHISTFRTKNVLIAVGGRPRIPPTLPQTHPRVIHSSHYRAFLPSSGLDPSSNLRIAVIGGGQSAAEIFSDIPHTFPNSKSYLILKHAALRPSDDSPFVNEVFDPQRVDDIYATPDHTRTERINADKATNYGVVRIELLEHIYEELYNQRVTIGNDETEWPRRILSDTHVEAADPNGEEGLSLRLKRDDSAAESLLDVDIVFVASGYERDVHEMMLEECRGLLAEGNKQGSTKDKKFQVRRDYGVKFPEGKIASGSGVWLQGCNEATHGLSDTLLSILAVRAGEIVGSIFDR